MSPNQISAALVTSESSSDVKVCFKALNFILGGFKLQKWVPGKILMLENGNQQRQMANMAM